ncbi:MAG: helix-turn-helix transcriptional regulator [Chloroflexota bacterium]|nr:helix-turn-helix transcriptional regulator [Chloroflexota bacterium]MDE2883689.1 helix-turn-helix transcriptional regulator [Chloroflexota bacterium]
MDAERREVNLEGWTPPSWPEDSGERLARLLEMAGISRRDLAEFTGVTERTVQRWLRGAMPKGFHYLSIIELARTVPGGFDLMIDGEGGSGEEAGEQA